MQRDICDRNSTVDDQWEDMLARSWEPRQWFYDDVPGQPEVRIMYVYKSSGMHWEVGYWTPNKEWVSEGFYVDQVTAAERVHWLQVDRTRSCNV